jgi:hypothetical protein
MTCGLLLSSLPCSTIAYQRVCWGGGFNKYQARPGDGLQRPLVPRSRFRQRLTPSVDMTSEVKSWEQLVYVCIMIFSFGLSEEPEPGRHDG